jgi:hypothetical protein
MNRFLPRLPRLGLEPVRLREKQSTEVHRSKSNAPAEGHHLIINRNLLDNPIAKDFANKIKTGPLSGIDQDPNQWSNEAGHPA